MPDWREVTNDTKLRVAFYGRVSTEHEMQVSALKNQIQWYEELAERNPNWEIIGSVTSYLDRGITGTQAKKRPNFLRLIEDAMTGKIDMIVTREVSRFARNTVETLNYVRELKEKGVEVYFVNDNIHSIRDNDGELRLTLMASLAQEESRKISEPAKAGQYISRKNGILYGTSRILGYTRVRSVHDKDKAGRIGDKSVPTFVIDEDEADTVRRIFQFYREGCGLKEIKITLSKEGRKNSSGEVSWFESTISRVLSNPMYIGKQEQCKTEIVDYLTGKAKQLPKEERVLVDGDFEPIIDEEYRLSKTPRQRLSPKGIPPAVQAALRRKSGHRSSCAAAAAVSAGISGGQIKSAQQTHMAMLAATGRSTGQRRFGKTTNFRRKTAAICGVSRRGSWS